MMNNLPIILTIWPNIANFAWIDYTQSQWRDPLHDKIEPAPGICEIFDKAQGQPFHAHLQEEDHSKYSVHVIKDVLQGRSVFQVNILKSLEKKKNE